MRWMRAAGRGLLVAAVIASGYAGIGPQRDTPPGRGPMTLATSDDLTRYLAPLLADWNSAHPGEEVTVVELPESADETRSQMITDLRADDPRYDILNIDVAWTSEFAAAGWISPLDRDRFALDTFLPPVVETATFDGRLYAVPYVTNAGLLYYRKDILEREGESPPRTWAELARQARTIAPRHGLDGYAGQFLPYEGLTANLTEAVLSAGGSLLADEGARVTVGAGVREALELLADGVREGWIPREALRYKEEESRKAFQSGELLFLRNWPYVYSLAGQGGSAVAGKFGAVRLPGPRGPGTSVLGGSNLAVHSRSRNGKSAADLIAYLTSAPAQRRVLTEGALPPVRADLYSDPALVRDHPYLPTLRQSILTAEPRAKSPRYDQVTLAVQAVTHDVLTLRQTPEEAVARLTRELTAIARRD
ncbi:ABC transporter substrate-binding protein [Streptomyces sp. N2-109]|uniref:ABC transporter substrate-binding protein n=1 Tax=Streptomyces gossypii TaxID=2883101 RepID=A0ABT2JVL9_9ACTN|nr:ABC transporter substrate-binding protein [Streptomyces gossypii]MCT2591309.1 ABC transporter substrate-binding protein [Streptomyces gossypii]